jgi:acetyl esterase/lipase
VALAYETLPGDIDHLIADDHAIVERQFQHLEAQHGNRRVLVDQISFELSLHAFAEETVLYPLWDEQGMATEKKHALAEHAKLKERLVTLAKSQPGEAEFEHALASLMRETRHHVQDEEGVELPLFRGLVGAARMAELGKLFYAAKRKAPPAPHPHAPSEGIAEKIVGAIAKPIDMMRAKRAGTQDGLATDATGSLHPQAQAIVDAFSELHPLPFETLEPEQARKQPGPADAVKALLKKQGKDTAPEPVGSVEDLKIRDASGGDMTLRVYKPAGVQPQAPILMWIHGGGWVLFTIDDHYDASCRGLCNKTGAIVVSPDYRRAPEAPFPASHDDVLAAYLWVAENADRLGGDPGRIAIGGESVGGNMAAATVLQLAHGGEPVPIAMVCVYPVTTGEQYGESMTDAADGRPLNRSLLSWMAMHAFEGQPDAAKDPRIDLLGWSNAELGCMPPTLVITDERDILRSQGQEFARKLESAGVPTTSSYYKGAMHEFFGASAVFELAEQAQQEAAQHLLRAFTGQAPLASSLAGPERYAFGPGTDATAGRRR